MSLDISLIDKEIGEEVMSLNWLRNPFKEKKKKCLD